MAVGQHFGVEQYVLFLTYAHILNPLWQILGWAGYVRVDNKVYNWLGDPGKSLSIHALFRLMVCQGTLGLTKRSKEARK